MLGLKRILLIDSFITGKRLLLMVDGHATVNGQNGSGKSSLLKLLQIFYGAEPRQVENRAGGKDSFVDWYLPRSTSLIIYEYDRIDARCCLVIYRHPTSGIPKPAYRFMKGQFAPERFSVTDNDGELEFLRGKELRAHWHASDVPFSKQIEIVTDYRAVIQNDVLLLRRSATAAENKRLAREYCLGDGIGVMQHIEKVCTAIQNQHGNLERMKDMLADIMFRGGVIIPDPPRHPENIGLSGKVRWLSSFEKEVPKIRRTLTQHGDLLATESRIASIHVALSKAKGDLSAQVEILGKDLLEKHSDIKTERHNWDELFAKLRETLAEFKANAERAERELDNLYRQHDAYEEQNVQSKKSKYGDLGRLQGLFDQARSRVVMLNENVSTQRQPFEQEERSQVSRHNKAISKLRDRRDSVIKDIDKLAEIYRERESELAQHREQSLDEKRESTEPERKRLIIRLAKAEEHSKLNIRSDEETARLANIADSIARLRTEAKNRASMVRGAYTENQEAQTLLDNAVDDIRRHKKHLATLAEETEHIQNMLYPEDGSWLSELRKQDPSWIQDVGRVVNPELFGRKDLKPEFMESKDNVFGWELDLAVVTPADAANSDEELRARLTDADEELGTADQKLKQLEQRSKEKQKHHKETAARLSSLSRELQVLEQKISSQESLQTAEMQQVADAVADRRKEAKKEAASLKTELDTYESILKEEVFQIKEDFMQAQQENISAEAMERSSFELQKYDIDNQITDEKTKHQASLKQLWGDFNKLCSEQGIDIETIKAADTEFTSAKATVARVQGYRNLLAEYETWLESHWSQREKHQTQMADNQEGVRETGSHINSKKAQHQGRLTALEKAKSGIESALNRSRYTLSDVTQKLDEIGTIPGSNEIEPHEGTPTHLVSEATETLGALKKQRRIVSQGIMQAESAINTSGDEQIAGIWRKSLSELETSLGKELGDDPNYWRCVPPLLESFVDDILPTIRETLIQTIVGVGQQLTDYFHGLKNADSSIYSYSSKISEAIVKSLDVDALSEVNIRLVSTIKDLDFWVRLESFVREWNEWRQSDYGDLPSNDLIEAMGTALVILDKVRSGNDLRSLFSLSLELRENGRLAVIRNDNDLANASSRGLSYLALCGIFIGITHYLCDNRKTHIHWPVDELEVIDGTNINRLFGMLDRAQITMVAGFPSKDANLLRLFKRHHVIDLKEGIRVMSPAETDLLTQMRKRNKIKIEEEATNA